MAHRRDLRGVASGIAGSFISRNNDVAGYWALGLLRQLADREGSRHIRIGLINMDGEKEDGLVDSLARTYALKLSMLLPAVGFSIASLTDAFIDVEFGLPGEHIPRGIGDPFLCTVCLVDDLGKVRSVSKSGSCWPHNPRKESRSTRASA